MFVNSDQGAVIEYQGEGGGGGAETTYKNISQNSVPNVKYAKIIADTQAMQIVFNYYIKCQNYSTLQY